MASFSSSSSSNSSSSAIGGEKTDELTTLGGWKPIKNMNDLHIQKIAEFAVTTHNKQVNTELTFNRVISGETQVVAGVKYRLLIQAIHGGAMNTYEAEVWEKPWESSKTLTSFKLVQNS